jgi:Domain of unknown function (DUF4340)
VNGEMRTTAFFIVAAAASLGLAYTFRPNAIRSEIEISGDLKGQLVFKNFDPDDATSFRIVKFNEGMATISQFELAKDAKTGAWTLPSSDGYPADSADQIGQAVAPLTQLTVLSTVSTNRGDHELYGVVEPKTDQLSISSTGVGMLVRVGGNTNDVLADLVIGKPVKGAENQHYVRRPAEDAVYIVEIKADTYSTNFDKWIKGEILSVRGMDIDFVGLRDYAIVPVENGYGLAKNFDADLTNKDNKWSLQKFVDHKVEGHPETNQLPEGQVLAESALNDLRNSIQNLKIVNVRRKPAGLAADLKANESLMNNPESKKSLQAQGFFPMESGEVFSAGGELIIGAKDGVRYLLRFGNAIVSGAALEGESQADQPDKKEESADGMRRYLLVTAQVDEGKFPLPELKTVPETVEEMLAAEAAENAKKQSAIAPQPATSEENPQQPQEEGKANTDPAAAPDPAAATPDPAAATPDKPAESPANPPAPAEEPVKPETEPPKTDAPAAEQPSSDPSEPKEEDLDACGPVLEDSQEEAKQEAEGVKQESAEPTGKTELTPSRQESPEELKERLQFLQETIKKENQRLLDTRNESIKKAKSKALEMNASFADWYYVVNESVYSKLRISREQLFKSASAKDADPNAGLPGLPGGLPPGLQLPGGN